MFFFNANAQNLVPNPSFEEYWECPNAVGSVGDDQLERCKYWYKPSSATTDYYNACQLDITTGVNAPKAWLGYQVPFEGNAYVGLGIFIEEAEYLSEYVQVKLVQPLEPCQNYNVRFWVSLGDYCSRSTNTLGARLDKEKITKITPFDFFGFELPAHIKSIEFIEDTINWVLVSGNYLAQGGEEYLTIGRFLDTNYYSNDNVPNQVVACNICFTSENPAYYFIDSVSIIKTESDISSEKTPNVLTVNGDNINEYWYPTNTCFLNWTCTILNRWGIKVYTFKENDHGWNGKDVNGKDLNDGSYFYIVESGDNKKTGFIQLIR